MQEGTYDIKVIVKDSFSASTGESATASYTAKSRVVGTSAVISPTANPLVALYSAPPSPGSSMYVQFSPLGPNPSWTSTAPLPIVPGKSTNFHRGWHATQHDVPHEGRPERWDGLRPSGVHDREPAVELDIPHLHVYRSRLPPVLT